MPSPQLFIGNTLRELRRAVLQRTCGDMAQLPLVFVPGFGAVRGWRHLAQQGARESCLLPRFAVTGDWFKEAALASADIPLQFVTPSQRRLVLRALLEDIRPDLNELKTLVGSNPFLQQLDGWMAQLFAAGVQTWPDDGGPWSQDLQFILQKYLAWQQRHEGELWDEEYAPHLYARFAALYPAPPRHVMVEGAVTLTPNEREGFRALISQCDHFAMALVVPGISPDEATWPALLEYTRDSVLEGTLQFWQQQHAEIHFVGEAPARAARQLHDLPAMIGAQTRLHAHAAHTPWHELRQTAQAIRERSLDMRQAAECGVIINNSGTYLDILKSTFTAYGLPLQRTPRQSLAVSPLVQKLMQLLNLPAGRWKLSALVDALGGDSLRWEWDGHALDVRRLEQVALLTRQNTLSNPEHLSNLLHSGLKLRDVDSELAAKDIAALAQLQERIHAIGKAASPRQWSELVDGLWNDVTRHWAEEGTRGYAPTARLQIADARAALAAFRQSSSWWEKYFSGGAAIWQSQLNLLLSEAAQGGQGGVTCGMNITSPRQLEQNVPDVIYWMGMTERDYPQIARDALQARHQKTIQRLCPHLPSPSAQSLYWLALALAEAREIHFSWPAFYEGRSTQPTVLLETLIQTIQDEHPTEPEKLTHPQKYFCRAAWLQDMAHAAEMTGKLSQVTDDPLMQASLTMFTQRHAMALNIYDGSLSDGVALMQSLWQTRNQQLELSASSLQTYAECGLKYFFQKVLLLKSRAENLLLLQKNETGSLIHAILEQFYHQFPHPIAEQHQQSAWELMCRLTTDEVSRLPVSKGLQQLELRRLIADGGKEPAGVLGRYILSEVELRRDWTKSDFAAAMQPFGLSSLKLPQGLSRAYEGRFQLRMEAILLEGKFDRLDVSQDEKAVLAVDYKTGNVPSSKEAPDGISFQLPLYVWALDQLFGSQGLAVGGTFYSLNDCKYTSGISRGELLKKGRNYKSSPRPLSEEEWADFSKTLSRQIHEIHALITQGQFPISVRSAKNAKCDFCDYRNICYRKEELQQERQLAFAGNKLIYMEGITENEQGNGKEVE